MSAGDEAWFSVITPPGRGAIAVVSAAGDAAWRVFQQSFRPAGASANPMPGPGAAVFGRWGDEPAEELMVCRGDGEVVEVHCHGGRAAVRRIAAAFSAAGVRELDWREYLQTTATDVLEAEASLAAAGATTQRVAALLLGAPRALRDELSRIEALAVAGDWPAASERSESLLAAAGWGIGLARPWRVAVAGAPNVGKSSLVNALLGYARAIVHDQPGVTRDVLRTAAAFDGWPVELIDAAGVRETTDPLEAAGVARALAAAAAADLVLHVLDATSKRLVEEVGQALNQADARRIVVVNKIDLAPADGLDDSIVRLSATTGAGLPELQRRIVAALEPSGGIPAAFVWTDRQKTAAAALAKATAAGDLEQVRIALRNFRDDRVAN